jgi:hypothetical protein
MFAARLAGKDAAIDQPGRQHEAFAIDHFRIARVRVVEEPGPQIGDTAILDQKPAFDIQA